MKKLLIASALVAGLGAGQAFALVGVGAHWAPNFGAKLDGATEQIPVTIGAGTGSVTQNVAFHREEAKIEQGFGVKAWLDVPVIPVNIEATANFQGGFYGADLSYTDPVSGQSQAIDLGFDMKFPLLSDPKPAFGMMLADLSVAYRPLDLSLAVIGLQGYVGGGVTYVMATKPLSKEIVQGVAEGVFASATPSAALDQAAMQEQVVTALKDAYGDPATGIGGHALVGVRAKLLFLSVYANGKYHFAGLPEGASHGLTLELGGGFGI